MKSPKWHDLSLSVAGRPVFVYEPSNLLAAYTGANILSYNILVEIRTTAFKHGVIGKSILHAVEFALFWDSDGFDSDPPKVLILGPDVSGNILEIVGVMRSARLIIFHAMPIRPQFHGLLNTKPEGPQ